MARWKREREKEKSDQIEEQSVQCRNNKPHNSGLTRHSSDISIDWHENLGTALEVLSQKSLPTVRTEQYIAIVLFVLII